MTKKKTYTPAPEVPAELRERYRAVLEVLAGTTTVAEAARRLGMSRNHFQTLMHRGLEGMIGGLSPGRAGRPPKPAREVELEAERDKLLRTTEQLEQRLDMTTRLMGLASELMKGSAKRTRAPKKKKPSPSMTPADDESEEPPSSLRDLARRLEAIEVPRALVARCLSLPESTLRRWAGSPARTVVRSVAPSVEASSAAIRDVRELRGLVGANALRQAHPGLSRRQAAQIKRETTTAMERERRDACACVIVTTPGVVRGFDAMDRGYVPLPRFVLIAADACVPFRTSVAPVERYDDESVACALDADFCAHGAPLVLRLDRAKAHSAPRTTAVLAAHQVLVLHGPPRHPRFYGQLERQNRDHSAWVHDASDTSPAAFVALMGTMQHALNHVWRRRALDWKTPAEVWNARPPLTVDRRAFRESVDEHARKLRVANAHAKMSEDLATRLGIERALADFGYLRIEIGRPVLGESETPKGAN